MMIIAAKVVQAERSTK